MTDELTDLVATELTRPVPPEARRLAERLAAEGGGSVLAILFYGSCLRNNTVEGVLDFYVIVDRYRGYHASRAGAVANAILPPTVGYRHGEEARAKIAVISMDAFARKMRPVSNDTTLWARFCQPSALLYARDAAARSATTSAIADAIATAAVWGKNLGPVNATSSELWTALFAHTYGAELRVEDGGDRGKTIYRQAETYFDKMLRPALAHAAGKTDAAGWSPAAPTFSRRRSLRSWRRKQIYGKILNISRLVKAAFTFDQKVEYIEWKVERHTGNALELTDFQRRHPLIAAPGVLWKLWRKGAIR
ncbi:MAG: hypothetical protein PVI41_03615 [Roseobacter sp.]|jgi:hypothetical protein